MSDASKVALIPLVILLIVLMLIIGSAFLASRTSGWQTLARRYPLRGRFPKPKCWIGYGVFRGWIGYNGAIVVSSDRSGLYMRTLPILFSAGHDPIYIPWSEIERIESEQYYMAQHYGIVTRQAREVRFALRAGTYAAVKEDARAAGVLGA